MGLFLGGLRRASIANALTAPLGGATSWAYPDFTSNATFTGLINPNSIAVASDCRVFIALKSGLVRSLTTSTSPRSESVSADQRERRTQISLSESR